MGGMAVDYGLFGMDEDEHAQYGEDSEQWWMSR